VPRSDTSFNVLARFAQRSGVCQVTSVVHTRLFFAVSGRHSICLMHCNCPGKIDTLLTATLLKGAEKESAPTTKW